MKLRPDQLENHLAKGLSPIYLISGDEVLLQQEISDQIRLQANAVGFAERIILQVSTGFDWTELATQSHSLSLFAEKQLIELRMPSGKPGDKGAKAIISYCENPPSDKLLLISTAKLEAASQKTRWFKAIEKAGVFIQIWPIDLKHLPQWITQRLLKKGISADPKAIDLLAERTEGNLLSSAQEIEKLQLLYGNKQLTVEDVHRAVVDNSRFDVFQLVDIALAGNAKQLIKILSVLNGEGIEPNLILWAITRELRQLAGMAYRLEQGEQLTHLYQEYRVWEKRKPLVTLGLKRLPTKTLQQLLQFAFSIERQIKGLADGNVWMSLERLCLAMAGVRLFSKKQQHSIA